ncbi:carboxymuconolactone decarboxylase family protein [Candidatus Xianfuyuplasma coldseepsis]|uniref:Carboxymuconolactone decarboxylase-like domain-containing protein n=1 Tax=Candidatus Xianfuyuplasma coldseepsis TaxID=2782163 RepID=A0A7L7KRP0_9MOLU|nr:carboxymuconolactone decarboxylase family protein [Xianfuyuplasma coldseepsis]QMS85079.1 hypothetical protein G4Z02_04760 [Xianfuyuplasma coldseepsis]
MTHQSRVFSIKEQLQNIVCASKSFVLLRSKRRTGLMNKKLKERIMLAVTEVNGCQMCSFVHTKIALQSGMTKEQIQEILNGDTSNIPVEDAVAVLFGQHFADQKEDPTDDAIYRLVDEYGFEKAELIVAVCNMITMTNGMGISMDHLWRRIRFKSVAQSRFLYELFNPLLTMFLFPVFSLFHFMKTLYKKASLLPNKYDLTM